MEKKEDRIWTRRVRTTTMKTEVRIWTTRVRTTAMSVVRIWTTRVRTTTMKTEVKINNFLCGHKLFYVLTMASGHGQYIK